MTLNYRDGRFYSLMVSNAIFKSDYLIVMKESKTYSFKMHKGLNMSAILKVIEGKEEQ